MQRVQRGGELLTARSGPDAEPRRSPRRVRTARGFPNAGARHRAGARRRRPAVGAGEDGGRVVTNREVIGKTLGELGQDPRARGVYLQSLQRGPELMPREPWTVVERGDILRIVGAPDDVERAGTLIGFVERDLARTDLTFLAGGICAGHPARPGQARTRQASCSASARRARFWWSAWSAAGRAAGTRCSARFPSRRSDC